MSKLIFILLILLIYPGCDKVSEPELIGKWELIQVSGGLSGGGYQAKFNFINIIDEKNCEWLNNSNNPVAAGKYNLHLSNHKNCIEFTIKNKFENFYFDSDLEYIFYSDDTLYMQPCIEQCNDCFEYFFIKEN